MNNKKTLLEFEELCERLSVGRNTAYRLLNSREIKGFKIGRKWKIPVDAIEKYIEAKCNQSH